MSRQFNQTWGYIYTIEHPDTGIIKYVGQTLNLEIRAKTHINVSNANRTPLASWIRLLKAQSKVPVIKQVSRCRANNRWAKELLLIRKLKRQGYTLLNQHV